MQHRPSSPGEARRLRDDAALRRAARSLSGRKPGKHRPVFVVPEDLAVSRLDRLDNVGRTATVTRTETAASVARALAWMEGR